jgi:hypothetical protein
MALHDRSRLGFEHAVERTFSFLKDLGFSEVESSPTLVRYRKEDVSVALYHGRLSYELGAEISYKAKSYELADVVRMSDAEVSDQCGKWMSSTPEGVAVALNEISFMMKRYCGSALRGDAQFFSKLEGEHALWIHEYWTEGLARQLRPQAEEAFREGDYERAAALYERIKSCLSPAEMKKLQLSHARSKPEGN